MAKKSDTPLVPFHEWAFDTLNRVTRHTQSGERDFKTLTDGLTRAKCPEAALVLGAYEQAYQRLGGDKSRRFSVNERKAINEAKHALVRQAAEQRPVAAVETDDDPDRNRRYANG